MKVLIVGAGMYVTGRGTDGCGTVIAALAQLSKRLPITEVVICATRESNRSIVDAAAAKVNSLLGSELHVRYDPSALNDAGSFDCAIVSVPDHLHFEIGARVIGQKLHCLMVKPLTPTLDQARRLVELALEHGVFGMVELHKRFDEQNRIVKRIVQSGQLGQLSYATVGFSQRIEIPLETFREWSANTNIFQYLGVHYADLIHFITGYRPVRASAVGCRGILAARGVDTFDSVMATVTWSDDSGAQLPSQFAVNWIDPPTTTAMSDQRYMLVGEHGRIECDQKNRGLTFISDERGVDVINPSFAQLLSHPEGGLEFAGYGPRSIGQFIEDVARITAGETTPAQLEGCRPTFREGLVSTAVVDAVNQSLAADGAWKDVRGPA